MKNNTSFDLTRLKDNSVYKFEKQDDNRYAVKRVWEEGHCWYVDSQRVSNIQDAVQKVEKAVNEHQQALIIVNREEFEKNENSFFLRLTRDYGSSFRLETQNLIGTVQVQTDGVPVTFVVRSRFEKENFNDPFLMRMLEQVMGIYLPPWPTQISVTPENYIEWLLLLLWVAALKQAYRHGIWKQYQWYNYNDISFRGQLDANRHIRKNVPFQGRIAYRNREQTADTPLNRLILATFLYIQKKYFGGNGYSKLLDESLLEIRNILLSCVSKPAKDEIWKRLIHLKPIYHPLYFEYENVRQLSISILRMENQSLNLSGNKSEVQGILFDVALLFENYIRSLLKRNNVWSIEKKVKLNLFKDHMNIVPDYILAIQDKKVILDAKYKRWKFNENFRSDIYQVMTYGYHRKAQILGIIHPTDSEDAWKADHPTAEDAWKAERQLVNCPDDKDHPFIRFPFPVSKYSDEYGWDKIEGEFLEKVVKCIMKEV